MSEFCGIVAVINPAAAQGRGHKLAPQLEAWVHQMFSHARVVLSESAEQVRAMAKEAAQNRAPAFLTLGGDGTAHYAIQSLVNTETALGIIPIGSGNDLSVNLGIPLDPSLALRALAQGRTRCVDVAQTQTGIYGCIAGVGLDSEVNRRANARHRWIRGRARYPLAILQTLASFQPRHVRIRCDQTVFEGPIMFAVFANAPSYGRGIKIAPMAVMDDGLLDVCVIKAMPKLELLRYYPQTYLGTHVSHPFFLHLRGKEIAIHSETPLDLFGDGEAMETTPTQIRILPQALRVLVPSGWST